VNGFTLQIVAHTCSLIFHTLLARPNSFKSLSNIAIGVSGPFPSLDRVGAIPDDPDLKE
jgi:hypothetical protein